MIDLQAFEPQCLDAKLVATQECQGTEKVMLPMTISFLFSDSDLQYLTLSHCWGKTTYFTTTRANEAEMRQRILYDKLPLTFRHAFEVARRLGIRYLWIDSLCIIQGDGDDWAREASKMSDVYSRCYATIAAEFSENSNGGLYNRVSTLQDEDHFGDHVVLSTRLADGQPNDLYISSCHIPLVDRELEGSSKLSRRGWALQERILSPRTLHFTTSQLVWECRKRYDTEGLNHHINSWYEDTTMANFRLLLQERDPQSETEILPRWYHDVVEPYSGRELSEPSDKLMALAGLANLTAGTVGSTYLAGMWQAHLTEFLHWESRGDRTYDGPPIAKYPSFSWASVQSSVKWLPSSGLRPTCEIIDHFIELEKDTMPFGNVNKCWIKLRGFTLKAKVSLTYITRSSGKRYNMIAGENLNVGCQVFLDRDEVLNENELILFELGYPDPTGHYDSEVKRMRRWTYLLILSPKEGHPHCYLRKGLCEIYWSDQPDGMQEVYDSAREEKVITLY